MKRFKAIQIYLLLILILSVSFITGCGGGEPGHWLPGNPDTTAPMVAAVVPANAVANVAINTKITATFSEAMDPLTITTATFTVTGPGATPVSGAVTYTGVTAVFTPAANLAISTLFTATITTGAKDLAGNALASNFVWKFTTGTTADTTAPTVTGTIHANGATNVAINTKVGATFSEGMDPLTITNVNFTLAETVSGAAVAGTTNYSGLNAVFSSLINLKASTQYTVTVKGGASGVTDLAGNPMAADFSIKWTTAATADTTAPTVTLTAPADVAAGVALNSTVNATFSEAMDPLTITNLTFTVAGVSGLVSYDALTKIATFTPGSNLAASTTYTATITNGAKDLAGNVLVVPAIGGLPKPNPWTFTTGTGLAPGAAPLLSAATYGTFGGSAGMTNTGVQTVINGDIGTIATGAVNITGFHDLTDTYTVTGANHGLVNGTIYTCAPSDTNPVDSTKCALATQARLDAQTAYLALAAMPSVGVLAGNLAGTTINPGVYTNASSVLIQGGDFTLDALGDANGVFVFQIGSTLTVGGPGAAFPQNIILAGGAQAKNVFWQVGTSATINAAGGGTMEGTIIANSGVTFSTVGNTTVTTLNGRAMSLISSITMVDTVINVPAP